MKKSDRTEIIFSGTGGQGVAKAAKITGMAIALYDEKHAVVTESHGPEARGGASYGAVISSNKPIDYPGVLEPDRVKAVIMSQPAYEKFGHDLGTDSILIVDEDNVKLVPEHEKNAYRIPATKIARELGNDVLSNSVVLGFFTYITGLVGCESMKKAMCESFPAGYEELNIRAFGAGYKYGEEHYKNQAHA